MKTMNLSGSWKLEAVNIEDNNYGIKKGSDFCMNIPGSVQDALINLAVVPNPYYANNELETLFIGKSDWSISRSFDLEKTGSHYVMRLEKVDTIASLFINDKHVKDLDNEHEIYFLDITDFLKTGQNTVKFDFTSSEKTAVSRNEKLKYPLPCSSFKFDSPNRNLVRKSQCNAACDWGLCLQTIGIYEDILIYECENIYIKSFAAIPHLDNGMWTVKVEACVEAFNATDVKISSVIKEHYVSDFIMLKKGLNHVFIDVPVAENEVEKWWPNGYGEQPLYDVTLKIKDCTVTRKIGFRTIEVKNNTTVDGKELTVCVNGQDIFCKGANWVPLDARPSKITEKRYKRLILSVKQANMNMLRVWGGGWYEKEEFYDACDRCGILVWHDLMFSCSTYPTSKWFLDSIKREVTAQIRRLKSRTCIALWCGNNECLEALGWYEETVSNRDLYLGDFEKLFTDWLDGIVKKEDPERLYLPSSPCAEPGAIHCRSVWQKKDFDSYHSVKPRFCSDFGFQSFPSLSEVKSFAPEDQLNLTSPVMEHHQRNDAGNSSIIEMFTKYFRMPSSFEKQLYLSQIQQAMAVETAVTYWRSLMPYCMGTLYWQLNDVWPVSSWSSIEYSGKWKALHYAARKFFRNVAPVLYSEEGKVFFKIVNDSAESVCSKAELYIIDFNGNVLSHVSSVVSAEPLSVTEVKTFDKRRFDFTQVFVLARFNEEETYILLEKPKYCKLENSQIRIGEVEKVEGGFSVEVISDKPSFYVMLDASSILGVFEDNYMFLNGCRKILFSTESKVSVERFKKELKVFDLFSSSQEN